MSNLKVIIFNGPPRSGKDAAADYMISVTENSHKRQFKDALIELTARFFGKSTESFLSGYSETLGEYAERNNKKLYYGEDPDQWYKDYKGSISQRVGIEQYSKREALIHVSENVIKPVFGKSAFGDAIVQSLPEEGIVFIPDSGFPEEVQSVVDHVGEGNVLIIRLVREGCTFEGDSRRYLEPRDFVKESYPEVYQVVNEGTLENFLESVEESISMWLGGK